MTEASLSMRFAQKNVLITGAAAGKVASRVGGDADEPVRGAGGSRIGDALSLRRGRERNDRSSHQRDCRIHRDVSSPLSVERAEFVSQRRKITKIVLALLDCRANRP
jgi:hypothetical protein